MMNSMKSNLDRPDGTTLIVFTVMEESLRGRNVAKADHGKLKPESNSTQS